MARMSESKGSSNYLKSKDLEDGNGGHKEARVAIESIRLTTAEFDGQNPRDSWEISFVGRDKVLDLNKTNQGFISDDCQIDPDCEMDGPPFMLNPPLPVILYVVPTQNPDGSPTVGLRMRKVADVVDDIPF